MVASFALIRRPSYYTSGTAADYYQAGADSGGVWLRGNRRLGVAVGTPVDAAQFERLCTGRGPDGELLVEGQNGRRLGGVDVTLSSPKSVSVLWAMGDSPVRAEIAAAEAEAVEATLQAIEREIPLARRGRNGVRREHAAFVAAVFTHDESRPEMHPDGTVMPSPQRHHHLCVPSILERPDGTWGAIDSVWVRSNKKFLGSQFRLALAGALQKRSYAIDTADDDWRWSIGGVPADVCRFLSARRAAIEEELSEAGTTSTASPALAAGITLRSRREKAAGQDLTTQWRETVERLGYEPAAIVEAAKVAGRQANRELTPERQENLIRDRLTLVPDALVRHQSTFERRHLLETTANALVGTKVAPERVYEEAKQFIESRKILTLGETRDGPVLSTPEMAAIERRLVAAAVRLAQERVRGPAPETVARIAAEEKLNAEQIEAAHAATSGARLVAVSGIAGSGKSAVLRVVARAFEQDFRVCAGAVTWKAAQTLGQELGVQSRAIDSWLACIERDPTIFDWRTVLLIDEAGLLSSPQACRLLEQVATASSKENGGPAGPVMILVGEEAQLRPVGPGHGMRLVRESIGAVELEHNMRQRQGWARDMVHAFAHGDAKAGLDALVSRGLLILHETPKATVQALVDDWENRTASKAGAIALIARTNAEVRAINAAVRQRLKLRGVVRGRDIALPAVDASGNRFILRLAAGDRIRFQKRNDRVGVINGTEAVVEKIGAPRKGKVRISARIGGKRVAFSSSDVADQKGRAKLAHAYALTLFQAQGITVDTALVLASPQFDRHAAYVAASRARDDVRFYADTRQIDSVLAEGGERLAAHDQESARLEYLANQFARQSIKTTTLDAFNMLAAQESGRRRERIKVQELSYEL